MENTTAAANAPIAGLRAGGFRVYIAWFSGLRRSALRCAGAFAVTGLLAGCMGSTMGTAPDGLQSLPSTPSVPAVTGQTIGTGTVRVGLLLPLSAGGSASAIAATFRNSAELAIKDFQGSDIQLLVKDTAGTAEGGRAAAQAAIAEGAELILGPVFAPAVSGAASVARTSGVPIVAFSTDTSVAGPGVYLLSFLPAGDVKRIISYAAGQNRRSYAALLPDDAYGAVTEAAFRQEVGRTGGRVVSIQRYKVSGSDTTDLAAKTQAIASALPQADALFLPAANVAPFVMQSLMTQGGNLANIKVLGSGQWDAAQVTSNPIMAGTWFPGPERSGFDALSGRYQATFGAAPARNASLAYDGTILAAGLVRSAGPQRFSQPVLTNRDGFLGIDGVFRFLANGESERGLAVYEIAPGGMKVISPAPRDFRAAS